MIAQNGRDMCSIKIKALPLERKEARPGVAVTGVDRVEGIPMKNVLADGDRFSRIRVLPPDNLRVGSHAQGHS
jgi:hypothetical protein